MKLSNITSEYNRSLLRELVVSEFKLRYQGSVLGYLWSIMKPLAMFTVLYIVFSKLVKFGDAIPNYSVYLLLGIVLWTFFVEATMAGLDSIVSRESLIRKVQLPKYIIVLASSLTAFINLGINMLVVIFFMTITGVGLTLNAVYFPLFIIELFIFSVGVSFFLSALYVKFRDFKHIWELVIQSLFYLTPIIYPLSIVSEKYANLIMLSPMAQIIQGARWSLVTDKTITAHQQNGLPLALVPPLIVLVVATLAALYFKKTSKDFAENV